MTKWNLPLTYKLKIIPVINGECRQTIRIGRKFKVGDLVRFYIWEGKPYRSKRKTITGYFKLRWVQDILLSHQGFGIDISDAIGWDHPVADTISRLDGITPPTGKALYEVLKSKNEIPNEGIGAQVIRW